VKPNGRTEELQQEKIGVKLPKLEI
jgi:hypothetical protein